MRLEELVVDGFRKLADRHVLRPAALGITVVSGDNEEGKSTLLDALKRGFFMKHNTSGSDREAIQPLGRDVTPYVGITFRLRNEAYRLEKHFRRNGVRLAGPAGVLEGDAAELALARLLAFDWPGRGPAKAEQMGLAGLLWVDQGTTFSEEQKPSPSALRRLQPLLADQVASLERGERAPRLMTEVRRQRDRFWTGSKGQPKGELLELEQTVAGLRTELADLEAIEAGTEQLLDHLAKTMEKRRAWLAADHVGRAGQEVERMRSDLARVRALEEEARVKAAEQRAAESELAWLNEKARHRQQLITQINTKAAELGGLEAEARDAAAVLNGARFARLAADAAELAGREALDRQEATLRVQSRQIERWRLERLLASLDHAVQTGRAAARTAVKLAAEVESESLTLEELAALEAEESRLGEVRAALRNVATRLVLVPTASDAKIAVDGEAIDPAGTLELTAPAMLEIGGFGRIEVTPGGERLPELRAALQEGETSLRARLADSSAKDVSEARRRLASKERCAREATAARQRLADVLAATGMKDMQTLEAAALRTEARLTELADVPLPENCDEAVLEHGKDAAERALVEASEQTRKLAEARAEAAAEEAELVKAAEHQRFAEARLAHEQARLEEQLALEREELTDGALDDCLRRAQANADAAIEARHRVDRELARAVPDRVLREVEQAARRLRQLDDEGRSLDREVERLTAELKGAGGRGIGDRKAEVTGRLELAERRHAQQLAEARAWRLLSETIEDIDRARQDALVAPLTFKIEPYLRELMGDAALDLAPDSLQLASLKRGAAIEPFKSLSIGAREQLAVLVRLAIGELLVERGGECPPLILDDALVYADAVRLSRMKAILEAAGARQQIIILTCRKEDYLGLDARYVTLDDCRSKAATA